MSYWRNLCAVPLALLLGLGSSVARAQFAVIDVGAIVQLIQQVATAQEQLTTARDQLTQAKTEFDSITGGRGMELILNGIERNYLPPSWQELEGAITGASGAYGALAAALRALIESNAILTPDVVATLAPQERTQLEAARRQAALLQATSRDALSTTSARFDDLQQLIAAIPGATDQKAILDLQARIAAELGMLQNENNKLDVLYQAQQAERWASDQRAREQAIVDIGSFEDLEPLGL